MFPYRRHGGKKRGKGPGRKPRGPQRPLPNSARDLLPMLQPATKALAQMLSGRTGASGQLNHARNLLAHAERLINDRVHNRLIPAEREEFFEQLARLRLTLADAEAEAEVQAAEEQVERRPAPPPVAQERLKEMALALSRPERDRSVPPRPIDGPEQREQDEARSPGTPSEAPTAGSDAAAQQERPALRPLADLPGRLVLSKARSETAHRAIAKSGASVAARPPRRATVYRDAPRPDEPDDGAERSAHASPTDPDPAGGNGSSTAVTAETRAKVTRRVRKTKDGLPEGWVIDEEGYVVPRHG